MKKLSLLASLSWIVCMTALGDTVLEFDVHSERTIFGLNKKIESKGRQTITIGSQQARFDTTTLDFVLDAQLGKLWVLFPSHKKYWEFGSPLRLEEEVPEALHGVLKEGHRRFAAAVHWTENRRPAMFGETPVFVSRGTVLQPLMGIRRQVEVMVDPESDLNLLAELRRNVSILNFSKVSWFQKIIDLGGTPVLYREDSELSNEASNLTITLVSREERAVNSRYYQVPEGYTRLEFSLDMLISFSAEPLPPGFEIN